VELRRMQMAGVSEFLDLRFTHTPELVARLADTAFARPLKQRVEAALSRFLPGDARALIRGAAEVAACAGNVDDLARMFRSTAADGDPMVRGAATSLSAAAASVDATAAFRLTRLPAARPLSYWIRYSPR